MIIPTSSQLRTEDFDAAVQPWIGRLLSPLNTFIASATAAINGRLSFVDNWLGQEKALTFTYAANTVPVSFMMSFKGTPREVSIAQATENAVPVIILAAWSVSGSNVQLTSLVKVSSSGVSALTVGATYNITVRVAA